MTISYRVFEARPSEEIPWEDDDEVFVFCEFRGIHGEGLHISSAFLDCAFDHCDLYLSLFNVVTFVGVKFRHCVFRGCSFADCRFVECIFENCRFTADNLGADCRLDESRWYGCTQSDTEGLGSEFAQSGRGELVRPTDPA